MVRGGSMRVARGSASWLSSKDVPGSVLKCETVLGTLDATPKVPLWSCEGKLGVLLESLQGQRDLIEACVQDLTFLSREGRDLGSFFRNFLHAHNLCCLISASKSLLCIASAYQEEDI